ncbi:MAG: NADP-dependent isocitrate dehydrogenase [Rickettsiales bacterium]|nr:MAG: NADP-dependent isocitrate dehydrogenase [Rickettsiales bacterium]
MSKIVPITVAYGDGIGPEIMDAVLYILKKAEAQIQVEVIEIGEKLYKKNYTSGIAPEAWEMIERNKILLKAPITTPQGGGYKSLNVTLRKALGLYANVRPTISYSPFVETLHPNLNVTIVRENEEDIYAGIEYRHTRNMRESIKLVSRVGCEKIVRYAFEYAVLNNRTKVSCFSKDNIMKFSDGIFHQVFDEIAKEYPQIKNEHYIVDIGTARLATSPEIFDVIVTSNLFGDIISDEASVITGSLGLLPSASLGNKISLYEPIHGSYPQAAGKNIANPMATILSAALMLEYSFGLLEESAAITNAVEKAMNEGFVTEDINNGTYTTSQVGDKIAEFILAQ